MGFALTGNKKMIINLLFLLSHQIFSMCFFPFILASPLYLCHLKFENSSNLSSLFFTRKFRGSFFLCVCVERGPRCGSKCDLFHLTEIWKSWQRLLREPRSSLVFNWNDAGVRAGGFFFTLDSRTATHTQTGSQAKTRSVAKSHGFVGNTLPKRNQTNNIPNLESEDVKVRGHGEVRLIAWVYLNVWCFFFFL